MSRPIVLLLGALLWLSFAVVAVIHVVLGDWMGPLAAVVIVAIPATLVYTRRRMLATASR
jgi:hypothetical protein